MYQNQVGLLKAILHLEAQVLQDQPLQQDLHQAGLKEEKIDYFCCPKGAINSVGLECHLDRVEVTGSNPV